MAEQKYIIRHNDLYLSDNGWTNVLFQAGLYPKGWLKSQPGGDQYVIDEVLVDKMLQEMYEAKAWAELKRLSAYHADILAAPVNTQQDPAYWSRKRAENLERICQDMCMIVDWIGLIQATVKDTCR